MLRHAHDFQKVGEYFIKVEVYTPRLLYKDSLCLYKIFFSAQYWSFIFWVVTSLFQHNSDAIAKVFPVLKLFSKILLIEEPSCTGTITSGAKNVQIFGQTVGNHYHRT